MPRVTTFNQYGEPTSRETGEVKAEFSLPEFAEKIRIVDTPERPLAYFHDIRIEDVGKTRPCPFEAGVGIDKQAREAKRKTSEAEICYLNEVKIPDSLTVEEYAKKYSFPNGINIHQGNSDPKMSGVITSKQLDPISYGQLSAMEQFAAKSSHSDATITQAIEQNHLRQELNSQAKTLSDMRKTMEANAQKEKERREEDRNAEDVSLAIKALDSVILEVNESIVRWHLLRNKKMSMQDVISLIGSHLSRTLLEAGRKRSGVRKMVNGVIPNEDRVFTKQGIRDITQAIAWAGYGENGLEGLTFHVNPGYEKRGTTHVVRALMITAQSMDYRVYYANRDSIKSKMIADGTSPSAFLPAGTDKVVIQNIIDAGNNYAKKFTEKLAQTTNTPDLCTAFKSLESFQF